MAAARDALGRTLAQLERAGECWPQPSTIDAVRHAYPHEGWPIWVDVVVEDTPVRVTISMGERLLARIDAAAEHRSLSRSGYLASAARRQLDRDTAPVGATPSQAVLEEVVAAGRKIHDTIGPSSSIGRALAGLDAIALDGLRAVAGGVSGALSTRSRPSRSAGGSSAARDQPTPPPPSTDPIE